MPANAEPARQEIERQRARIETLFTRVAAQPNLTDSLEFKSEWAGYLCIRISGAIEVCVREVFKAYVRAHPDTGRLGTFVSGELDRRFRNMDTRQILALLGEFDPRWKEAVDVALSSECRLAVDSIVKNTNRIAHGADVSVSFHEMEDAFPLVFDVIELVAVQCGVS